MSILNMTEIKKKTDKDLEKMVAEKREELRKIRFESAGSGMRNTQAIQNLKREIARILTELNNRARTNG